MSKAKILYHFLLQKSQVITIKSTVIDCRNIDETQLKIKNIERWLKRLKDQGKIEFRSSPTIVGYFAK